MSETVNKLALKLCSEWHEATIAFLTKYKESNEFIKTTEMLQLFQIAICNHLANTIMHMNEFAEYELNIYHGLGSIFSNTLLFLQKRENETTDNEKN